LRLHIEHILEIKGKILEINKNGKKWINLTTIKDNNGVSYQLNILPIIKFLSLGINIINMEGIHVTFGISLFIFTFTIAIGLWDS